MKLFVHMVLFIIIILKTCNTFPFNRGIDEHFPNKINKLDESTEKSLNKNIRNEFKKKEVNSRYLTKI